MNYVDVREEGSLNLDTLSNLLAGVPNGMERALRSTMPRVASHVRTQSNKAIRNTFDIKNEALNAHGESKAEYILNGDRMEADVLFKGTKVPLIDFSGSGPKTRDVWDRSHRNYVLIKGEWKYRWPGRAAKGAQLKGHSQSFDDAFIGMMPSGHVGIFDRTGGMTADNSSKIHQLMGDAPPQMIYNPEVLEPLSKSTAEKYQERFDHEVERLLNGWGR